MSDQSETTVTRRPYHDELEVLDFLGGDGGGYITRRIAVHLGGNADLRRRSQWTRQILLAMQRKGWVEPMDSEKPIVWRRTQAGTEVLNGR